MWSAATGDRIGTFHGHKGTIWDLDIDRFSSRILTASADATCKLWDCQTGELIQTFVHHGPVRGVAFAEGGRSFATVSDPFVDRNAQISIYDIDDDEDDDDDGIDRNGTEDEIDYRRRVAPFRRRRFFEEPRLEIELPKLPDGKRVNPTNVVFLNLNEALFVTFDNGSIRLYDPENGGQELEEIFPHEKKINRVSFNLEKTLFITSSADHTAKLYDVIDLRHLKTYRTDRPVNDAVISETKEHILLGGGQEAMSVTTTSGRTGKFETRFFHLVYEEEFGTVKGHFGPINALAINPDGKSYVSGAEDGYVRLHFFDKSYLDMKDPVPEELQDGEETSEAKTEKDTPKQ